MSELEDIVRERYGGRSLPSAFLHNLISRWTARDYFRDTLAMWATGLASIIKGSANLIMGFISLVLAPFGNIIGALFYDIPKAAQVTYRLRQQGYLDETTA